MVKKILWAFSLFIIAVIVALGAVTPHLIGKGFHTDKILHIFVFGMSACLMSLRFSTAKQRTLIAVCLLFLGLSIEFVQFLAPGRDPELGDVAANIVGILYGLIAGYLLKSGYYAQNRA